MIERRTTTFLFIFFFFMFGFLVAAVAYNYQLVRSFSAAVAWFGQSDAEAAVEVASAQELSPSLSPPAPKERVLGTHLSLLPDTVPYPVVRISRDPASIFAPRPADDASDTSVR